MPPPTLPQPKNWRRATTLNLLLPGAGLFYLGWRKTGAILAASFLICLAAALGIFLVGYLHYLNVVLGGDLMKEGQLEELANVFHKSWLFGLLVVGLALLIISIIAVSVVRKQNRKLASPEASL